MTEMTFKKRHKLNLPSILQSKNILCLVSESKVDFSHFHSKITKLPLTIA